jgi:hypothetical protein
MLLYVAIAFAVVLLLVAVGVAAVLLAIATLLKIVERDDADWPDERGPSIVPENPETAPVALDKSPKPKKMSETHPA